jgi:hypothetical protein
MIGDHFHGPHANQIGPRGCPLRRGLRRGFRSIKAKIGECNVIFRPIEAAIDYGADNVAEETSLILSRVCVAFVKSVKILERQPA